jgi:hypothetical protein
VTAICGGGASGPKAGVPEVILLGGTAIAQLFTKLAWYWAIPLGVLVGQLTEEALAFCGTDPPADPGFTSADATALLNLTDFAAVTAATAKLRDLALIAAWYEFCQCSSTTTPAVPPALSLPPSGMPQTPAPTGGTCWAQINGPSVPTHQSGGILATAFISDQMLPLTALTTIAAGGFLPAHPARSIVGLQWLAVDIELTTHDTSGSWEQWAILRWYDASDAYISSVIVTNSSFAGSSFGPYHKVTAVVPANAAKAAFYWYDSVSPSDNSATVRLVAQCASSTGAPVIGCAPDPAVRAMLDQILQLITLIQRQHVPFASIAGETYSGLSGSGIITLGFPCLALRVDLTTTPSYLGYSEGEPDRLFDAGWITPGTSDSWEVPSRVSSDPFVRRVHGDITRVGYSFPPGVVASITERRREY